MKGWKQGSARDLGIKVPIIQAPVGGGTWPRLAAAVSNAGDQPADLTEGPFGPNLVLAWAQHERMSIALEAMANYSGQGVELVAEILPAAEIVRRIAAEARAASTLDPVILAE